jgi:ATP-binding cassette subfamily B protein
LRHTRRTLALVWRSSPGMTVTLAAVTLVGAGAPLGVAYVGKRIVDAVVEGSRADTLRWVLCELALILGQALTSRALQLVRSILGSRLGIDINVAILEKALTLELADFEDPEFYDRLTRARREASSRPISLLTEAFFLVQNLLTLLGYVVMLVKFSGWAVLALVVATVPATIAEMRFSKLAFRIRNWRSPDSRRLIYLEYVLANDEHAKEVKLFGLGPLLLGRYKTLAEAFHDEDRRLAMKRAAVTQLLSFLGSGAFYGAYAVMALAAAARMISLGTMTLYVVAFRQGQQSFQSVLSSIGSIYEHNLYMSNLFLYLGEERKRPALPPKTEKKVAASAGDAIVFEDVGFRYPDQERWVLRHIDLRVPVGQSLALVGENGAGKTTLIKLLTRLYRPSEGRIFLFGRDLNDWDEDELRAHFGVVFQDFNQYQLKMRENVGLGSVPHLDDEPRIERAVELGGASEVVKALPSGLDTPLGRWFANGTELSGGQWQKVALSRALMRNEADVLILDEPTAALDAQAEHAVFERFRKLAEGRTTIVISHRFPTVRMADRILVLEQGQITESGTHAELVAAGKTYAKLFALQAAGYQ